MKIIRVSRSVVNRFARNAPNVTERHSSFFFLKKIKLPMTMAALTAITIG